MEECPSYEGQAFHQGLGSSHLLKGPGFWGGSLLLVNPSTHNNLVSPRFMSGHWPCTSLSKPMLFNFSRLSTHMVPHFPLPDLPPPWSWIHCHKSFKTPSVKGSLKLKFHFLDWFVFLVQLYSIARKWKIWKAIWSRKKRGRVGRQITVVKRRRCSVSLARIIFS